MPEPSPDDVSALLIRWSDGDRAALDQLMPLVYSELHRLAGAYLRRERPGHSLQSTGIVHEAFLKLVDQRNVRWQDRAHFYGVTAQIMRRILVDHARAKHREKRGGPMETLALDEGLHVSPRKSVQIIALDDALTALAQLDQQQCTAVEMRFFGGLTLEETAEALRISRATVHRDWVTARAWLMRELAAA